MQSEEKLSEKWELVVRRVLSDLDWDPGPPGFPPDYVGPTVGLGMMILAKSTNVGCNRNLEI